MKVCVITDNAYIFEHMLALLERKPQPEHQFEFYYSPWNHAFRAQFGADGNFRPIRLKEQDSTFFDRYDLFLSLHCKQLFPSEMVENHLCINVHPGYNPYNRGWFPQVFGIMNKLPIGVTIHKMDTELDHGPILYQEMLELRSDETSKDIYMRILALELKLLEEHLDDILSGNYTITLMETEGNINTKQDFDALCQIDLDKPATYQEVIDFLRAMTFSPYQNAYFYDQNGRKVYVEIALNAEDNKTE